MSAARTSWTSRAGVAFLLQLAYGPGMHDVMAMRATALSERGVLPWSDVSSADCVTRFRVPTGAALLALELSEESRGVRGLDVLRRSVDRAPPVAF